MSGPRTLVEVFTELLEPYGIPPSPLHAVLHEAANRAGWRQKTSKAQRRQVKAALGRTVQREQDLALRRVLVSHLLKKLPARLQAKPASLGTAQAILGRLDNLPYHRKPP